MQKIKEDLSSLFLLNKDITYLNHGSFGACPKPIFNSLLDWQTKLEKQPVQFLDKESEQRMYNSRKSLSEFINFDQSNKIVTFKPGKWDINKSIIKF